MVVDTAVFSLNWLCKVVFCLRIMNFLCCIVDLRSSNIQLGMVT